jgi:hypothetical protein
MLMLPVKKLFPALSLFLALGISLFARDVEVIIEDGDIGLPLEGAVIRSWDAKIYECDEAGRALVSVPDDRPVVIQAAYPGYDNGRFIIAVEGDSFAFSLYLSGGVLESAELVIEASQPGISETRTGRSVAVNEEQIARTAEIGIIEDVMSTIKLLPGVGYAGFFNAQPSIRGGAPGDLMASLDGFYVENPYHWGGGFSIFDPRMVQSAQLSHGVFSVRYGHSISGLLEITSKQPSPADVELEMAVSTSAADLALSLPVFGKGGIRIMGRVTYYDPVINFFKLMIPVIPELEVIKYIRTAPYIRSVTLNGNYRFNERFQAGMTGFFGADGIGVFYENVSEQDGSEGILRSETDLNFDYRNMQGFLTGNLTFNPLRSMVLKTTLGAGFYRTDIEGWIRNDINVKYSDYFKANFPQFTGGKESWSLEDRDTYITMSTNITNVQGRADFDWDLGKGFIFALGAQELYTYYSSYEEMYAWANSVSGNSAYPYPVNSYQEFVTEFGNHRINTSAFSLVEYTSPQSRFSAELGLRLDHLYFAGKDFTIQTYPVLNPRLNLDFIVFRNRGFIDSLSLSAGAGLFSSDSDLINSIDGGIPVGDYELRPARSVTGIAGTKIDFLTNLSFNIEGYYKHVYDRTYQSLHYRYAGGQAQYQYRFDGVGSIWGFDLQLQKMEGRYLDGWLSYSFNYARYRNPNQITGDSDIVSTAGAGNEWFFPNFHRYNYLNLVANIKPQKQLNLYLRLGFASGVPLNEVGNIRSTPVMVLDKDGKFTGRYIETWTRDSHYSETNRTTFSFPMDLKFSVFRFNRQGKAHLEMYFAIENVLGLALPARGNTSFNSYTGEENTGDYLSAVYEMPVPIPSFGFKWSY